MSAACRARFCFVMRLQSTGKVYFCVMEWQMKTELPRALFSIRHSHRLLLLGSCFTDEMGQRLQRDKFPCLANPFGTLYNPASIAAHLLRCVSRRPYTEASPELVHDTATGLWHSWMHHSSFAAPTAEALVARLNATLEETAGWLSAADVLFITMGTASVYRLRSIGLLVANCHKQPDALFQYERLSAVDIVDTWTTLLQLLHSVRPSLRVVLTVSPVRHSRAGLHGNQLSKAELLLACDALASRMPEVVTYFPAYEILVDELRDYRFYAADMAHPTPQAADYIYDCLCHTFVPPEEQALSLQCRRIASALAHRPFHADGAEHQAHLRRQLETIARLQAAHPTLDFTPEISLCNTRLKR